MNLHNIPPTVLFEAESLKEISAGPVIGMYTGAASGYGYGRYKAAAALEKYIKEEGLDPANPEDMKKINAAKKRLAMQYKVPMTIAGYLGGQVVGGMLKGASQGVNQAIKQSSEEMKKAAKQGVSQAIKQTSGGGQ